MQDDKHYNYWENWFKSAYQVNEFSALNTLWLTYFIAGGSIEYKQQKHAFKKILQTVYTSLSDIIGILFLASKCLGPAPFLFNNYISNSLQFLINNLLIFTIK